MAGVFDFGTRFGEGYMAGSQLTAQREARKAQQMNTDRDFALRESQAVIESERANLRDEMTRQGLLQGAETLQYNKQKDIDRRTFDAGEAEKQRAFMGDRYKMEDRRKRRQMDIDELKIINEQLKLDPGNEELKNWIKSKIIKMREEDGMPMPAPSTAAPPQAAPAPEAPREGIIKRIGRGAAEAQVGTVATGLDVASAMVKPMQEAPMPAYRDSAAMIPPRENIPGGFVGPPPLSFGDRQAPALSKAAEWLRMMMTDASQEAVTPARSAGNMAPMGRTGTSSASMGLADDGASLPDVPGTHGNKPKRYASKILKMAKEIRPGSAPPEFEQAAKEAEASTGIPANLLLGLAAAESAYEANAVSSTGAKGPFQFIGSTGRQYGLVGDGFDDRSDVRKSAQAAAQYLKDLSAQFDGNIGLALMAYNQGPEAVRRALNQR